MTISIAIVNSIVNGIFEHIATDASKLDQLATILSREIQTAVSFLPNQLATWMPVVVKNKHHMLRKETYSSYIYKVLKQAHPDIGIIINAIAIVNSFVNDIFEHIATEASKLDQSATILSREIQTAVWFLSNQLATWMPVVVKNKHHMLRKETYSSYIYKVLKKHILTLVFQTMP